MLLPEVLILFPQRVHKTGFSPVWVLIWHFKSLDCLKATPQLSQTNGLSFVCFLMCTFSKPKNFHQPCSAKDSVSSKYYRESKAHLLLDLKHSEHVSQLNGLKPVCILWWKCKDPLCLNPFPHTEHRWGFSPVCSLICSLNELGKGKFFLHTAQV